MEQVGIFTMSLQLVRSALKLLPKIMQVLTRFNTGLLSQILSLLFIWLVVPAMITIFEKILRVCAWLMHKFE